MKKFCKGVLIVFAVVATLFVLLVGGFAIVRPDLARAVYNGFFLDKQQIEEKKKENDRQLVNTINDFGFNLTESDLEKMNNGELSEEELKNMLLGKTEENADIQNSESVPEATPEDKTQEQQGSSAVQQPDKVQGDTSGDKQENIPASNPIQNEETSAQNKPAQPESKPESPVSTTDKTQNQTTESNGLTPEQAKQYEERTAELIARMYALKSQYIGQINGVVALMKADYAALPKEQRNKTAKTNIANSYLGQISALETQCDAQVDAVVTELRDILAKSGKDMSLADAIVTAYNNEKETTKASYINEYAD